MDDPLTKERWREWNRKRDKERQRERENEKEREEKRFPVFESEQRIIEN